VTGLAASGLGTTPFGAVTPAQETAEADPADTQSRLVIEL
jgi:hypothetical protein